MAYAQNNVSTVTASDISNALRKRLQSQGHRVNEPQLQTLVLDIMAVIVADSANAVTHATTELVNNPQRPFVFGV